MPEEQKPSEIIDITDDFTIFVKRVEPTLRNALVAYCGREIGREATAEALLYAWQHRERVLAMKNPAGFLYRVGQSRSRSLRRQIDRVGPAAALSAPDRGYEPSLIRVLRDLPERQRVAVVLCIAYGHSVSEAAEVLHISRGSVQRHVERGLARLRSELGVELPIVSSSRKDPAS